MRETVIPMSRAANVSQRMNQVTCCPLSLPPSYSSPTWYWDSAVIMCDKSQRDDNRPYASTNTMWWLLRKTQKLQIRCSYVLLLFVNALDVLLSRSRTSPAGWRQVERMEEGCVVVEWPAGLCSVSLWNFNHRHLGGHLLHFTSLTVKDVLAWAVLLKRAHTHVGFCGLRGLSIGVMVFILNKLCVLLPYTYPTPKLSPHRRLCAFLDFQKNTI